jgi:nitrite reductase/ring-hydroxylating ferredoxin subunit
VLSASKRDPNPREGDLLVAAGLNKVLVLRLDPEGFDPETKGRTIDGVVAYSAICPHTGCDVTNWHPDKLLLECPCHYSMYDPKGGAKVFTDPIRTNFDRMSRSKGRKQWRARCRHVISCQCAPIGRARRAAPMFPD